MAKPSDSPNFGDVRRQNEELWKKVLEHWSTYKTIKPTVEGRVESLEELRSDGNRLFAEQNWRGAVDSYSRCINFSFNGLKQPDTGSEVFQKLRRNVMLAYSNRAEGLLRLGEYEDALVDANNALEIDSEHVKTLVRKGRAAHELGLYEKACQAFKAASKQSPEEPLILESLRSSTMAYEQSQTGNYDLGDFFSNNCFGVGPFCADFVGPVEIRRADDVRGGRGLFATRNVGLGELLLVSNPLAVTRALIGFGDVGAKNAKNIEELTMELRRRILSSKRDMARVYSLGSDRKNEMRIPSMDLFRPGIEWVPSGDEKSDLDMDFLEEIVRKRRFEFADPRDLEKPGAIPEAAGLWILPAFANHSCAPNCQHLLVGNAIFLRVSRPIMDGEGLTVAYFHGIFKGVTARQATSKSWMFTCKCERCLFEENLQPQLFKAYTDLERIASKREQPGVMAKKLRTIADKVEAVIQSLGTTLSLKQQAWIRATFFTCYINMLDPTKPYSQSTLTILTFVVDSMTYVTVSFPFYLKFAAMLLAEVERSSIRDQQLHRQSLERAVGLRRICFGELPSNVTLHSFIS